MTSISWSSDPINLSGQEFEEDHVFASTSLSPPNLEGTKVFDSKLIAITGIESDKVKRIVKATEVFGESFKEVNKKLELIQHVILEELPEGKISILGSGSVEKPSIGKGSVLKIYGEKVKGISIGINSRVYIHKGVYADGLTVGDHCFVYLKAPVPKERQDSSDFINVCPRYTLDASNSTVGDFTIYQSIINYVEEDKEEVEKIENHLQSKREEHYLYKKDLVERFSKAK